MVIFWYRIGTLPFEPGKFSPPILSGDISIISQRADKSLVELREITSFLNLDVCVYVYVLTACFFLFPSIYTFFQLSRKERMRADRFLRKYCLNCFRVLTLLLDQE